MFELPSMWNLIISTIVFIIAAWYVHRIMDEREMPKGTTRSVLVFLIAYAVSWGAGEAADWAQEKIEGKKPASTMSTEMQQLQKATGQSQP